MVNVKNNSVSESGSPRSSDNVDEEIGLYEIFQVIWKGKTTIATLTFMFAIASIVYALSQPNIYRSDVLLAPAEQGESGALSSFGGQLGGLASLAGVNLGNDNQKFQLALQILTSRQFTGAFIERHDILPDLMAVESWDSQSNIITYDNEVFDAQNKRWVRKVKLPYSSKPSLQEAYEAFSQQLSISVNSESGFVTLMVEHISPYVAQQWVEWLVEDINETMRLRDVVEAKKSTEFLRQQLEKTEVADIQGVLYGLIEEQMKTIMFANIREEYVFNTVDAALVPERKLKPKRAVICILGTLLGSGVGMMLVFASNLRKQR